MFFFVIRLCKFHCLTTDYVRRVIHINVFWKSLLRRLSHTDRRILLIFFEFSSDINYKYFYLKISIALKKCYGNYLGLSTASRYALWPLNVTTRLSNINFHSAQSSRPSSTQPQASQPNFHSAHSSRPSSTQPQPSQPFTVHTARVPAPHNHSHHNLTFTVHTARVPAPHNHSHHMQYRTPYAAVHTIVLLMMGIMMLETC